MFLRLSGRNQIFFKAKNGRSRIGRPMGEPFFDRKLEMLRVVQATAWCQVSAPTTSGVQHTPSRLADGIQHQFCRSLHFSSGTATATCRKSIFNSVLCLAYDVPNQLVSLTQKRSQPTCLCGLRIVSCTESNAASHSGPADGRLLGLSWSEFVNGVLIACKVGRSSFSFRG